MTTQRDIPYESESTRLKEAFGATIAARRRTQGFEQREFARVVGISNSHLRKIESGETSPTLSTIAKLAGALGTDASDLVDEACRRTQNSETRRGPAACVGAPRPRPTHSRSRVDYSAVEL